MTRLVVDLGGTAIKRALGTPDGLRVAAERPVPDPADLLPQLAELGLHDLSGETPTAVAVAVPGVVDPTGRRLVRAHEKYADLIGHDLAGWAEDSFGAPAMIENDARAALLGETTAAGCARGSTDVVVITLGTGIGTAALIDGVLLRGRHGHAGILGGHQTLDLNAPRCPCGNVGCAETLASGWALADRGGLAALFRSSTDDPSATATLRRCLAVWGASVVTLCHAYDPEVVVVTGGVMRAANRVLPPLTAWVHDHLWPSAHRPELRTPTHPDRSVLLGLDAVAAGLEPGPQETP